MIIIKTVINRERERERDALKFPISQRDGEIWVPFRVGKLEAFL